MPKNHTEQRISEPRWDRNVIGQFSFLLILSLALLNEYDVIKIISQPAIAGLDKFLQNTKDVLAPEPDDHTALDNSKKWVIPEQPPLVDLTNDDLGKFAIVFLSTDTMQDSIGVKMRYRAIVRIDDIKKIESLNYTIKAFEATIVTPNLDGSYSWGRTSIFLEKDIERLIDKDDSDDFLNNFRD